MAKCEVKFTSSALGDIAPLKKRERKAILDGIDKQLVYEPHVETRNRKRLRGRAPKPFIAAVDGIAAAGGFGIAMACDLVLASERATFEWADQKTGLTGAESSTFFLPRLIGLRRSMEPVLLNPRLDARAAREAGLVTAVYPTERFDEEVLALARKLAAGPTRAYGVAKGLLNQAAGVDRLDYHLDQELEHLARIPDGPDFAEGLDAFFSRRSPHFGAK